MKCNTCGGIVPEGAAFCPLCGVALGANGAGAQAGVQPGAGGAQAGAQSDAGAQPYGAPQSNAAQPSHNPYGAYADATAAQQPYGAPQPGAGTQQSDAQQPHNPYAAQPSGSAWQQNAAQQPYGTQQPYGAPVQQPYGAPVQQPVYQPAQTVYAEGCISAAIADVRASEGWVKKSALLGLIACVPILNFVCWGYALNWSREVPFGGRTHMPKSIVNGKNFEIGFYFFLISLVFGLTATVVSGIVGLVPLLGWVAAIVISLGVSMFQMLCAVRMAMMQQLGEGFKIGKAWEAMKRNWTSLFCAAVVPSLVAGLIITVFVSIAVVLLAGAAIVPLAAGASYMGSVDYTGGLVAALGALGVVGVLLLCAVLVVCFMIDMAASLITYRAVAHWVGRFANEWTGEVYQAAGYYGTPRS